MLASAAALALPGSARAQTAAGRVVRVQGEASLLRAGAAQPLTPGAALYEGDSIRTGADGKARIEGANGLVVVVGPQSEVAINHYLEDRGYFSVEMMLGLVAGIVRLIGPAHAVPRRLEVLTRSALASVRSTDWLVSETAAGTGVFAQEGSVVVNGLAGGMVTLGPGEGTDVAPGAPPTPPRAWGAARRDEALARTTL